MLAYGRNLFVDEDGQPQFRLNISGAYEDVGNDPNRNDRTVLSVNLTKRITDTVAAAAGVTYANRAEFLGDVDKEVSAYVGLKYRIILGSAIDTLALDSLTARFPQDSVVYFIALELWDDDSRAVEIAHLGPESFTFGEFLAYGMAHRSASLPTYTREKMYGLLDGMLDAKSLDVAALTLEERDSTFAELMNEYRDGIILFRVMEDSVWNKASGDSVGLAQHYEANAESYMFSKRRRVVSFFAGSDSLLGVVAASWTPGDSTSWSLYFEDDSRFRIQTSSRALRLCTGFGRRPFTVSGA